MRLWYARRCSGWTSLWCWSAGVTAILAVASAQTLIAVPLWPAAVALSVAVASLLDEPAAEVVDVAPRSRWWRCSARLVLVAVPLGAWLIGVAIVAERDASLDPHGWQLVGAAVCSLSVGAAATLATRGTAMPGGIVGSCMALLLLAPAVRNPLPESVPLFPSGDFPSGTTSVWLGALVIGLGALWSANRTRPATRA